MTKLTPEEYEYHKSLLKEHGHWREESNIDAFLKISGVFFWVILFWFLVWWWVLP